MNFKPLLFAGTKFLIIGLFASMVFPNSLYGGGYYFAGNQIVEVEPTDKRMIVTLQADARFGDFKEIASREGFEGNIKNFKSFKERYVVIELSDAGVDHFETFEEDLRSQEAIDFVFNHYKRKGSGSAQTLGLTERFNVKLKEGKSREELQDFLKDQPVGIEYGNRFYENRRYLLKHDRSVDNVFDLMDSFRDSGLFEYLEPDFIFRVKEHYTPNDSLIDLQWPVENTGQGVQYDSIPESGTMGADMNVKNAWNTTQGGNSSIRIAILETEGVDTTHPDLAPNLVEGWDIERKTKGHYKYKQPHATAVAGLAAAKGDNTAGIAGICYDCSIVPIRFTDGDFTSISDAASAIEWAWHPDHGNSDVINMSFGFTPSTWPSPSSVNAFKDAYNLGRCGKGTALVASAGNNNTEWIEFPAIMEETFTISGSNMCDGLWHYDFSNHHPAVSMGCHNAESPDTNAEYGSSFGRPEYNSWDNVWEDGVNFAAPAMQTITTDILEPDGYNPDGDYIHNIGGGTSFSAPLVSGTIGLMLSTEPGLNVEEVEGILAGTADKIDGDGQIDQDSVEYTNHSFFPHDTWNKYFGYGRINTGKAVDSADQYDPPERAEGITFLNGNDCHPVCFENASDTFTLKSPMGDYGDITWYKDGEEVDTDTAKLHINEPGYYEVRHNGVSCKGLRVDYCCEASCPQRDPDPEPDGVWEIDSGEDELISGGIHRLPYERILIEPNAQLTVNDAEVVMRSCSEIIVEPGGSLEAQNSEITSCNGTWRGIKVLGDPFVSHHTLSAHGQVEFEDVTVSDAYIGLYSKEGGYYDVNNSNFRSNYSHHLTEDYEEFIHFSRIEHTNFYHTIASKKEDCHHCRTCAYTFPDVQQPFHQKYHNVTMEDHAHNNYFGYMDSTKNLSIGIRVEEGEIDVSDYQFDRHFKTTISGEIPDAPDGLGVFESEFTTNNTHQLINVMDINGRFDFMGSEVEFQDGQGMLIEDSEGVSILSNDFYSMDTEGDGFLRMVDVKNSEAVIVEGNSFNNPLPLEGYFVRGVVTDNTDLTEIKENNFNDLQMGTLILNNNQGEVDIEKNTYDGNYIGLAIATHENPHSDEPTNNTYTDYLDVEVFCNKFLDNNLGIMGSGDFGHQYSGGSSNSMDNEYDGNVTHDVLWDNGGTGFTYYEYNNTNPLNTQQGEDWSLNGVLFDHNDNDASFQILSSSSNCFGSWLVANKPTKKSDHQEKSDVTVYPVPFQDYLRISGLDPNERFKIRLFGQQGRIVKKYSFKEGDEVRKVRTKGLNRGIYILRIYSHKGNLIESRKVVKQ